MGFCFGVPHCENVTLLALVAATFWLRKCKTNRTFLSCLRRGVTKADCRSSAKCGKKLEYPVFGGTGKPIMPKVDPAENGEALHSNGG